MVELMLIVVLVLGFILFLMTSEREDSNEGYAEGEEEYWWQEER